MENELPYPEHGKYEWLPILYDMIGELKPKKIIEFGPGSGYTTIAMAKALQKNNIEGHINSYDIWDDSYWGKQQTTQAEYGAWGVDSYITLENLDFFEWIKDPVDFDFMYFDINNTSEKLITLYNAVKSQIDNMYDIKEEIGYKILTGNVKYSASTIYNTEMYNLDFS